MSLLSLMLLGAAPLTHAGEAARTLSPRSVEMAFAGKAAGWAPVHFERFRNEVMFKARINGLEANVLLDNGAGVTIVDEAFAQKAGMVLGAAGSRLATGSAFLSSRQIDNVTFEIPHHLTITGPQNSVDLKPLSRALGRQVDAVLGGDLLDMLAVVILSSNQTLMLVPSGRAKFNAQTVTIPLIDGNKVEGLLDNQPVKLKVDLGSSEIISLNEQGWRRVIWADKPVEDLQHAAGEGVILKDKQSLHHELKLGPISGHDVAVGQNRTTPGAAEDGLLGEAFFAQFDTVLDVSAKTLTLIPKPTETKPAESKSAS